MERIKNFFYDISDGLIKLLVIACMVLVIVFKLNTAMPDINILGYAINSDANGTEAAKGGSDNQVVSIDLTQGEAQVGENTSQNSSEDANAAADSQQSGEQASTEVISKTIVVPSGYTTQQIGDLLQKEHIVKDFSAFMKVVEELGYTQKLKSGDYQLNSDMTYEEIAQILVGN